MINKQTRNIEEIINTYSNLCHGKKKKKKNIKFNDFPWKKEPNGIKQNYIYTCILRPEFLISCQLVDLTLVSKKKKKKKYKNPWTSNKLATQKQTKTKQTWPELLSFQGNIWHLARI